MYKMVFFLKYVHVMVFVLLQLKINETNPAYIIDIYKQHPEKLDNFKKPVKPGEIVDLYKFMNTEYYGLIKIGHPAKEFKMVFDTTWGDIWVPSQHCGFSELACLIHNRYDSGKSSTYQQDGRTVNITTNFYSLWGFLSRDNFYMDHKKVENQTFIEMTHMSLNPFLAAKADGIIGLGYASLSQLGVLPFFYNLYKQKIVSETVFTFYLNRDASTEKAGRLILGGTSREHVKGNLTYVSVLEKMYWKINMKRIVVEKEGKSFPISENITAIFDTSTDVIRAPKEDAKKINTLLGAREIVPQFGRYVVNCREYAKLPSVQFTIGDTIFITHSKYYITRLSISGMEICFSPFVESEVENLWELGGAFLSQFYTEYYYDEEEIAIGETVF